VLDFVKEWFADDENKFGCRFVIVDAVNTLEVLTFYQRNGFDFLFTTEQQEDLYTNPPKDEEEKASRFKNTVHLNTRIMYFDLLTLE
jgi:phage terminase large subunit-like protein